VVDDTTDRRHSWFEGTLIGIRDPFLAAHPQHRAVLTRALDLIASDPYALGLREYLGHDASGKAYVHSIPGTHVDVVFCLIEHAPGRLGLFQVVDWEDPTAAG